MSNLLDRDYFTDYEIARAPYAWFEAARQLGPVCQPPGRDYLVVTGFDEIREVLLNADDFSSAIALQGAAAPLPFEVAGSDISDLVRQHQADFQGGNILVNIDGEQHSRLRSLVNRLFTPSRLKANEEYMADYADEMVRSVVKQGRVKLMSQVATPYVTVVVADLLGVPKEDQQLFMDAIAASPVPGNLDGDLEFDAATHPFAIMGMHFAGFVMARVENPQDDILSELANAQLPDGSKPSPLDVVTLGMFMFGAGQDTSAKLLGTSMKYLIDQPGLQDSLRQDRSLIPAFVEEVLRIEGSTKQTARLATRDTKIGDYPVPAGTRILLALSAGNRDSGRWPEPEDFELGRDRIKEHLAFGRGAHTCSGAPLARVEMRVMLEKFLEHTAHIDLDEDVHGNKGQREFDYEPSFIIRGLSELHLKLAPKES